MLEIEEIVGHYAY